MDENKVSVRFKIRRFDLASDAELVEKTVEFSLDTEYNVLKTKLQEICKVSPEDNKVIKLRREDEVLVPLSFILEDPNPLKCFFVDVCKINYANKATASLLQDAYIDSVCAKLRNMESRVVKAELLLPQLEWRRQAHMEETVDTLSNRVAFLNRRVDELLPAQWRSKMPQTMA